MKLYLSTSKSTSLKIYSSKSKSSSFKIYSEYKLFSYIMWEGRKNGIDQGVKFSSWRATALPCL